MSCIDNDDNFTQHTTFDFPFNGPGLKGMYTCNGLVCLSDFVYKFFLWNPCVRKCMELPSPNVKYKTRVWFKASIGFEFDAKNNDFKVVRVVSLRNNADNADIQNDRPEVEVYSLSTGEWRMVTASLPPICLVKRCENQVYANGAIHWLAFRRDDDYKKLHFVLVFNLGDEVFQEILLPKLPESTHGGICELHSVYGNSIALLQRKSYFDSLNIWVMKEYGIVSSWTNFFAIVEQDVEPWPIGFRRNGQVVLKLKSGGLVSQDLESQERKDLRITSGWISACVDSYVESLVLLDKPANSSAVTY
jgi:F-box interacting protein